MVVMQYRTKQVKDLMYKKLGGVNKDMRGLPKGGKKKKQKGGSVSTGNGGYSGGISGNGSGTGSGGM